MLDVESFKKMYTDGAKYSEMKKAFGGISFSTINTYRIKLGLPKRERSFERFPFEEQRFLELYNSKNPYYTYSEISAELGCSESLIVLIKRRMNLPDREVPSKLLIDEAKFKSMYLAGNTHDQLCEEFNICVDTIRRLKKKFNLPSRKKKSTYNEKSFIDDYNDGLSNHQLATMFSMERKTVSSKITELGLPSRKRSVLYNEAEFRKAHASGMSSSQLADKFKIRQSTVYWHIQNLGLSSRANEKNIVVEPLIEPPEPPQATKNTKSKKIKDSSEPTVIAPVSVAEVQPFKNMTATFAIPPKSLRELEKLRLDQNIRRAEQKYKITHKENGYCGLIGKEIDNQIADPFNFK